MLGLHTSTGMLERFCEGLVMASIPSLSGRPPQAPQIMSTMMKGSVVGMQPADADHAVAALAGRRHAVRHDLRQRAEHGVDDAIAG